MNVDTAKLVEFELQLTQALDLVSRSKVEVDVYVAPDPLEDDPAVIRLKTYLKPSGVNMACRKVINVLVELREMLK